LDDGVLSPLPLNGLQNLAFRMKIAGQKNLKGFYRFATLLAAWDDKPTG
jgi:hypothetical protein